MNKITQVPENINSFVENLKFQNYHRHSSYSNISTPDSGTLNSEYAIRAVELGHGILSSCEHGFQGNYWEVYKLSKKYNLKFIFSAEAYWVKDRFEKDKSNNHICLIAKNEKGRRAINRILSEANITGYYYKPRVDLELLLSLPSEDVIITSACIAFFNYGFEETDKIIYKLHQHFKDNFLLEVQYHNVDIQKELNRHILDISKKLNIEIIMGCDSHYIYPSQKYDRDYILEYKHIKYESEEGFYLDYPDTKTAYTRFKEQGVLTDLEILNAINNTNILLEVEDITFNRDIKLPSLFPEWNQEQKDAHYKKIIVQEAKEYFKQNNIQSTKEKDKYMKEIAKEVNTVIKTKMTDYFLLDYYMVKKAKNNGGIITKSGRGCFTETSLVHTKKGLKQISKVKKGDYVITQDGKFNKVLNTMEYNINENLIQIKHEGGTDKYYPTICTLDHKILCHRGNKNIWIQAKDLTLSDKVCIPKMKSNKINNDIIDLNNYNIFGYDYDENYIYEERENKVFKIKRFIELNEDINILLGLIYGGGYVSKSKLYININLKNKKVFSNIKEGIGTDILKQVSQNSTSIKFEVISSIISHCIQTEFIKEGKDNGFNEKLFNQNKDSLKGLLYGLNISCSYVQSLELINAYKILNMTVGDIPQKIVFKKDSNNNFLYKCNDIEDFTEDEEFRYLEIKEIKHLPQTKTKVYDLTIENEHNYLINNMVVHNSAVSFFTNTLLGFSNVDRLISPVHLFPERFMSTTRILETKSLPDIDLNTGTPEILEQCQRELLGEGHSYPMLAFGTLKVKSAWKMYAGANEDLIDFETANEISKSLSKYEKDLLYADEDERDLISVYDYIEEKYHTIYDESKKYRGIIMDKKKHPCGHLIYSGNIKEEIGLIKCKSESTKKEYIVALIDGVNADYFKFLKNDLLKVDVSLLHKMTADRAGVEEPTIKQLISKCNSPEGKGVWDIYKNGFTLGVNQCEKPSTTKKVMKYKPRNDGELACFVASIRPSFKTMYPIFEKRERFNYGIPAFDNVVQTETIKDSFLFFQEQIMATLAFAGIPIDECYGLIKAISKKNLEYILKYEEIFFEGFKNKIMEQGESEDIAQNQTEKVWTIIKNSARYGFNASHAYCMACDSLRDAHDKYFYPYEFYEIRLNYFSETGKKDKVSKFKQEMKQAFNIEEGEYKFGLDNRKFTADKEHSKINPSLLSIKGIGQNDANELYELSKNHYDNFFYLYKDIKHNTSVNDGKITTLIKIGYFKDFGRSKKLLKIVDLYNTIGKRKQFSKDILGILNLDYDLVKKYSKKETEKTFREIDVDSMLLEMIDKIPNEEISLKDKLSTEIDSLGFPLSKIESNDLFYTLNITVYKNKHSITRYFDFYNIKTGEVVRYKVTNYIRFSENEIKERDIVKINQSHTEPKRILVNGKWVKDKTSKNNILDDWTIF